MAPCNTISTVASSGMGSSGFISAIRRFEASLRGAAQKGWFFNKTSSFYPLFKKLHRVGSGQWAVGSGQWAVGSGQWAASWDCSLDTRLQLHSGDSSHCSHCSRNAQTRYCSPACRTYPCGLQCRMLPTRCCPLDAAHSMLPTR
jgi:hypothetical protein